MDGLGEVRQHLRVEGIGLRQAARRLGEIADLAWIDHDHRQTNRAQRRHRTALVATGRLQHDQLRGQRAQARHQRGQLSLGVGHAPLGAAGAHADIQPGFGHSDAHEAGGRGFRRRVRLPRCFGHASLPSPRVLHGPALRDPTLRDTGSRPRRLFGFALRHGATTHALTASNDLRRNGLLRHSPC